MSEARAWAFYEGFAWAVPTAFAAAVHACRFEQGDVLYSDASAYADSKRTRHPARHAIQVLDPPRTARALSAEGEGQRFFSNWESTVHFDWFDYEQDRSVRCEATQGQLFRCLWRGDLDALTTPTDDADERPLLLRDLLPRVEQAGAALADALPSAAARSSREKFKYLFSIGLDLSSDASVAKAQAIETALATRGEVEAVSRTPVELGLEDASRFHPALVVRGYASSVASEQEFAACLREVLYAGSGEATREQADRFQLTRHGAVQAL